MVTMGRKQPQGIVTPFVLFRRIMIAVPFSFFVIFSTWVSYGHDTSMHVFARIFPECRLESLSVILVDLNDFKSTFLFIERID